jgi:hypothetical protein
MADGFSLAVRNLIDNLRSRQPGPARLPARIDEAKPMPAAPRTWDTLIIRGAKSEVRSFPMPEGASEAKKPESETQDEGEKTAIEDGKKHAHLEFRN